MSEPVLFRLLRQYREDHTSGGDTCGIFVNGYGDQRDTRCALCRQVDALLAEPETTQKPCAVCTAPCDTEFGVCLRCIKNNPTRVMATRRCAPCNNEWISPSLNGNCPKCHGSNVTTVQVRVNGLKRL